MKKYLWILLICFVSSVLVAEDMVLRVQKFLWDNGQSNKEHRVDFYIQDSGQGSYISIWKIAEIPKPAETNLPSQVEADAWEYTYESTWYDIRKTDMQKQLDNLYYGFLTNEWTACLRENGILASNQMVTVTNTTSTQNIEYLMYLRLVDKEDYYIMAGEFSRFREELERLFIEAGWLKEDAMLMVTWHNL